ncbi:drebrin-like isoform X2 [Anguilla anguilla]|uniref:drebrin-like isoform X2 n=1 Tax=Anguilla anguilla TaxID=7936 RepID=UPI0015AACB5E|nr:drebrin-like isoform X2 [Anguilla anguilla]
MAVNLSKNRLAILTAYQDVIDETSSTDWALYMYEDNSDDLTLASTGGGGLEEITDTFDNGHIMYGFCSLKEPSTILPHYILINWVGEDVPDARKCACASHVATIAEFFQGVDIVVNASSVEDIDPVAIGQRLTNGTVPVASPVLSRLLTRDEEGMETVGTSYQKTNAEMELKKLNREEFWEKAKREEELRKEEERRRAAEERQRFEEERMALERQEQEERERRYRERERQIEEHRRKLLAQEEEAAQGRLKAHAEGTQEGNPEKRESEVEVGHSAIFLQECAAAAFIIGQRRNNPRDFFRQRERAMACSFDSSSVNFHRTGRLDSPFLKTQHSLPEPSWPPYRPPQASYSVPHIRLHASSSVDDAHGDSECGRGTILSASIPKIITTPIPEESEDGGRDEATDLQDPPPPQSMTPQSRVPYNPTPSEPSKPQEMDDPLDLWETTFDDAQPHPHARPQPLLSFDEFPEGLVDEDDPSSLVDVGGPHQMTLSYQHALQRASGSDSQELDDGHLLLTNGDSLLKEGAQASEGYFSQSQEEEFAQSEECSSKETPMPVLYNKPPEIDITCWDADPVMEEEEYGAEE